MRSALILPAVVLSIGALSAQTAVTGPVEGFTFDHPTMSLRPVVRLPRLSLPRYSRVWPDFLRIRRAPAELRADFPR